MNISDFLDQLPKGMVDGKTDKILRRVDDDLDWLDRENMDVVDAITYLDMLGVTIHQSLLEILDDVAKEATGNTEALYQSLVDKYGKDNE